MMKKMFLKWMEKKRTVPPFVPKYSPPIADFIAEHDLLRAVTRVLLLPLIGFSAFMVKTILVQKILVTMVFLTLLTGGWLMIKRRELK